MKIVIVSCLIWFTSLALFGHGMSKAPADKYKDEIICLSVKQLSSMVQLGRYEDNVKYLAHINFIEGCVIDVDNHDIIIIGKRYPDRSFITIDDLCINIRNIWDELEPPYCSLDPYPENLKKLESTLASKPESYDKKSMDAYMQRIASALGNQKTVIGGVPRNSRHANTMIYADYIMKKYSQGLIPNATVKSCIDIMSDRYRSIDEKNDDLTSTMSRFWFHMSDVSPSFKEGTKIIMLDNCGVSLLTEMQMQSKEGSLADAGVKDPVAFEFASSHSELFPYLLLKNPEYAELENLYRLQAMLRSIKHRDLLAKSQLSLEGFTNNPTHLFEKQLPASLPCLTNYAIINKSYIKRSANYEEIYTDVYCPFVFGGVSMQMDVNDEKFIQTNEYDSLANKVIQSRPHKNSLTWSFPY